MKTNWDCTTTDVMADFDKRAKGKYFVEEEIILDELRGGNIMRPWLFSINISEPNEDNKHIIKVQSPQGKLTEQALVDADIFRKMKPEEVRILGNILAMNLEHKAWESL